MSARRIARPLGTLLLAAILATVAAGCGGGSDDSRTKSTKATKPTATAPAKAPNIAGYPPEFQQFARCLSQQGLNPPPPPGAWMAPGGPGPEMLRAAARCRRYLPPYGQALLDQMLPGG
jgi:hypothetical protein